jgi:hypothetical protein
LLIEVQHAKTKANLNGWPDFATKLNGNGNAQFIVSAG